jgi:TPR repeat protein
MATFGGYEVVEELYRTPFGYVCSARRQGSEANGRAPEFIVKVFEAPDTDGDGLPGPDVNGAERFLRRIRLQQKLSQADARHWARVYELGDSGDKPFYVTDYYARTAQKLIMGRVILGPAALHEIITSIAIALRELQEKCSQSHGSLKPSNVLIGGSGEVSGAKIVLTDPACGEPHGETEDGGDLHALGALLYQLVLHRPFHNTAWPVQDSEEWSTLGKAADGWRELCNGLLNPDPAARLDAASLDRSLAALAPHGISVKQITHLPSAAAHKVPVKKILIGLTVLVFLAAGGGGFLYFKQAGAYSRVRQARAAWIDALWNDRKTLNQFSALGGPVMQQSDWDAIQLPDRPRSPADFSLVALRRSQGAEATMDQVHHRLLDVYDKAAAPLRDLQKSFDHEGYAQAAGYLGSVVAAPAPDEAHLPGAITARIALAQKLKGSRPGMSPATAAALDGFGKSGDRDLQGFAAAMRAAFGRECVLTADGWSGAPELDKLAQQIASVQNWPTGYDAERLHREEKLDGDHVQVQDIKRWLAAVNQYAWATPTDAQRAAGQKLTAQLTDIVEQVRKELLRFLPADGPEVQKLDQERSAIQKQIDQLAAGQFIRKDLPEAFDGPAGKLTEQIASLPSRYKYQPSDLATWFGQMQSQHFNTPTANEVWARWMKGRTPANIDLGWKGQTAVLAKTLTDLESNTFAVPTGLDKEPWAIPSRQRAEEAAAKALGQIPAGATELPPDQLTPIKADFTNWYDEVTKLKQEHERLLKTIIDAAVIEQHDTRWSAESDRKFWTSQVEAGPFAPVMKLQLERIATVRAVLAESAPEKLIDTVRTGNRAEVVIAAWTRLGPLRKRAFPGPLTAKGVEAWADVLAKVDAASEKLPPVRQAALQKQVAQSGEAMWLLAINGAESPELLEAAGAAAAKLHLTPDLTGLSPVQRFDLSLSDAIRSNTAKNVSALSSQIAALPEWDRAALQQLAARGDLVPTTISKRGYLWPDGETERKQKRQNLHINSADQIAKANALIEDYQPQAAKAALEGLSGPDVDSVKKQIEELEENAAAQLRQGNTYYSNHRYPLAFREFQQAAHGGNAEAMLQLGRMYRAGSGVPRNRNLELKFFRLAAAVGNVEAIGEVAVTYFSFPQWPVDADSPEVAAWFKTGAEAGNVDAMAGLAQIALQKHDLKEAAARLTDADAKDTDRKQPHLGALMRQLAKLYEARQDPAARKWFQSAADRGDSEAQAWLRR